jgi:tartrate dehydrogenase/decarboxylase/D-malate dehydrogenase
MREYRIAAIPGDGIGIEVIAAGLKVLEVLAVWNIFPGAATTI